MLIENYTKSKELWKWESIVYHRSICSIVAYSGGISCLYYVFHFFWKVTKLLSFHDILLTIQGLTLSLQKAHLHPSS